MNELLTKFGKISKSVSDRRGKIKFFAVLPNANLKDEWDVYIAATWFEKEKDKKKTLDYLIDEFKKVLDKGEFNKIAKFHILSSSDSLVTLADHLLPGRLDVTDYKTGMKKSVIDDDFIKNYGFVVTSEESSVGR